VTDAMAAGTVRLTGHGGDDIEAYLARPVDRTGFGSVVVLHHMPGYDEPSKEITRRFASRGYAALMPNLHYREAPGASPDDAAAATRANGGVPDDRLVGDVSAAVSYLKALDGANGKAGIIGYCSGGRQSFLAACKLPLDAAVDCYGAAIVRAPEGLPIKMTPIVGLAGDLSCPLLGLFGEEDKYPTTDETAELSAELTRLGKEHEFHTYPNAGHSFFSVNRPSYRPEAASEGWERIWEFYGRLLAS
jgi:carboxymethylenebutenolidase